MSPRARLLRMESKDGAAMQGGSYRRRRAEERARYRGRLAQAPNATGVRSTTWGSGLGARCLNAASVKSLGGRTRGATAYGIGAGGCAAAIFTGVRPWSREI